MKHDTHATRSIIATGETLVQRWSRRAITVPAFMLLGVSLLIALPATCVIALCVDSVRRTGKLVTTRCTLALTLYFFCEALGIIASAALWVADVALPSTRPARFEVWNLTLQRRWASVLFSGVTRLFRMRVEISGSDCVRTGPLFLFSRHASTLDTLLPVLFAGHPQRLRLAYVMKRELLWDPCLDIVGQRTRNAFIRRGSGAVEKELALLRQLAQTTTPHDAVLLFPEGTRFTPQKREQLIARLDQQHAKQHYARSLRHVLPPRRSGALALLDTRPDIDVVFLAHTGFEGMENLNDLWQGKIMGRTIHLHFWRVAATDIPADQEARIHWLNAQWIRMDEWIELNLAPTDPAQCA